MNRLTITARTIPDGRAFETGANAMSAEISIAEWLKNGCISRISHGPET